MKEHDCILDLGYPESFLSSDEFFVRFAARFQCRPLVVRSEILGKHSKGTPNGDGHINFIKNDFAQQTIN